MSDLTEHQSAYSQGAAQRIVTKTLGNIEHVLIPPGSKLHSLEALMPAPQRIKANPEFYDVAGFADYADEFKGEGTRIFVDQASRRFFTIFDFHAPGKPAWGDHAASLKMELSPEWIRFKEMSGKKLSPMDLAEFLEENITYIEKPIKGAELLTMAQNLKVQLKGNLDVEHSTQSGLKKLLIQDDSTLHGKSGKKELAFPEQITLNLRVFDNHSTYEVPVFLRYRVSKDGIVFWFTIPDPNRIEEQAFDQVINEVADKTGLKTLKGKFEGPRHRSY